MQCFLIVLPLLSAGCGDGQSSVHGTVTCNGEPLAYGVIIFKPVDAPKEIPGGADIIKGEYHIRHLKPGKKTVIVKSQASPQRIAAKSGVPEHTELVAPPDPIPADASGNSQSFDIAPGDQPLDLQLEFAPKKK
jgi:hypothetical protein